MVGQREIKIREEKAAIDLGKTEYVCVCMCEIMCAERKQLLALERLVCVCVCERETERDRERERERPCALKAGQVSEPRKEGM